MSMKTSSENVFKALKEISSVLASECGALCFSPHIAAVYNPLEYAIRPHNEYLKLAASAPKKIIFLGMNPGPWGMAQTGVPFGEISAVRDWLGIEAAVDKPKREHCKRPIEGFACARSEVSGRRLWGLFRERFKTPRAFFRENFVANYCPLVFMDQSGANITPDKLPKEEAAPLFEICDRALEDTIRLLKPQWVIGIGGFAKKRIDSVKKEIAIKGSADFRTAQILHPSPASPKANAGWDREVIKMLAELEVWNIVNN
jgi:single-strand selective monofunctional uracil DNA glycosylase